MRSILLMKQIRGTPILVGLPPDRFALRLDPFHGAEDHDAAVEHAQAAFDFGGEVDVARRVDDVDRRVLPAAGDGGRVDGDAASGLFRDRSR